VGGEGWGGEGGVLVMGVEAWGEERRRRRLGSVAALGVVISSIGDE